MAAKGQHDRPGAGIHPGQAQVDDLAALRFDREVDPEASTELLRPRAGRHHGVPARDPLARDTDAGDGASLDDHLVHRCVADLEPVLRSGAQQCRREPSAVDPCAAVAVDRTLDVGKRRKQRPGLVRPDLAEAMVLGRAPAAHAGPDLMEMRHLVVVHGDGQRAAHPVAGSPAPSPRKRSIRTG